MALSKEKMREYQRARRAKFDVLKAEQNMVGNLVVNPLPWLSLSESAWEEVVPVSMDMNGLFSRVAALELLVGDLGLQLASLTLWVAELVKQLSLEEVSRKTALRPGGHPTELYGA